MYSIKKTTLYELIHRESDPLPVALIQGRYSVLLDQYPDWERRNTEREKRQKEIDKGRH